MIATTRTCLGAGCLAALLAGGQLTPATALADNPQPVLHNVTYKARVDGVSRGAEITYAAQDNQTQTANPTMLPGRDFEADTVLPATAQATMRVSIQWPYSANLHCEILVDDAVVAQAEHFVAPRALPVKDDPDYGALTCEAPVSGVPNNAPPADADGPSAPPVPDAPPAN
ncbi:MAG TPA: hypothetical protein VFB19_15870 [Mycobacterium sp.]|nr:hypothetical protein [Mycobacterium sp.]